MNALSEVHRTSSMTQPNSAWFAVHSALGISPIDHLFNRLDGAYPNKWRANFPTELSIRNWSESWVEEFEESGITFEMVKVGIKACRTKFSWPPSCAEFIQACKPAIDPLKAYYEAVAGIQARERGEMGVWEHPAIFWAASSMAYELKSSSYSQVKVQWEKSLAAQLFKSEHDPIPNPAPALTYNQKTITKEEAQHRIEKLGASGILNQRGDAKDWARRIVAEPKKFPGSSVKFANEALGLS